MQQQEPRPGGLVGPTELIEQFPGEPLAVSDRRGWVGLEALRYRYQPPNGAFQPPLTHHSLLLFLHTPTEFEARYEGVNRAVPPPAGSVLMVPAGRCLMGPNARQLRPRDCCSRQRGWFCIRRAGAGRETNRLNCP